MGYNHVRLPHLNFKKHTFVIIITVVGFVFSGYSQRIFSKKFSIDNGLLSTDNYRTYQDLEGYIWILSERGISKFDGYDFTYFTTNEGLKTNDVWEMIIDSKNRKWLRFFGNGIQYIEGDKVKTIKEAEKLGQVYCVGEHEDTVFFVREDREKSQLERYFLAPDNTFGVYTVNGKNRYLLKYDLRSFGCKIFVDNSNFKQYRLDLKSAKLFNSFNSGFCSVEGGIIKENEVVVSSSLFDGFYIIRNGNIFDLDISKHTSAKIIKVLFDVHSNTMFVNTDAGYFVFSDPNSLIRNIRVENILNNSSNFKTKNISNILIDNEENIWITENRSEIHFVPVNSVLYHNIGEQQKVIGNAVSPLQDLTFTYFIFRPNRLLKYGLNKFMIPIKSETNSIRQIEQYNNQLFVLGATGLYKINRNQYIIDTKSRIHYEVRGTLKCFSFISADEVIFNNGEIFSLKEYKVVRKIALPINVSKLASKNSILVYVTNEMLGILDLKTGNGKKIKLKNIHLLTILEDHLVVGYENNKLKMFTNNVNLKQEFYFQFKERLNDIQKSNHQFYVATDEGLIIAELNETKDALDQRIFFKSKFYGFQINNLFVKDNLITLFTTKGVLEFGKNDIEKLNYQPSIPFNIQVYRNKKLLNQQERQEISGQNSLSFKFVTISYFNLGEVVYKYKLKGEDANYQYSFIPEISYNSLKPGKYELYVSTATSRTEKFQDEQIIEFEILSPFYTTWWFFVLVFFIIVGMVWIVIAVTRKLTLRLEMRKLKLKDLELKALRAQLNPHFVSNSLNTIQSLLLVKGPKEANIYITSFSEMIRGVLDSSRKDKILLTDEIKFLQDYLYLENRRLNETLDYSFDFSGVKDMSKIKVYSMVFQPIIENAITHAFKDHQNKKLKIVFKTEFDKLITVIDDNGIGISSSNSGKVTNIRTSHSSMILMEKAVLLNSISKEELTIKIVDLGERYLNSGTRVIITMRI